MLDTPYASQYVSLLGVVVQNVVVLTIAGPRLFAQFTVSLAVPLLGIGFLSRGLDIFFASEASSTRKLLSTKAAAGVVAGGWCILANELLLDGSGATAIALLLYVAGTSAITVVEVLIVREQMWAMLLGYRAALVAVNTAALALALSTTGSVNASISLVSGMCLLLAFLAVVGPIRNAYGCPDPPSNWRVSGRQEFGKRPLFLFVAGIALVSPNNLLSNGFLLIGNAVLASSSEVATLRLLLLGAGTAIAAFPLSQPQISAIFSGAAARRAAPPSARIFVLPLALSVSGALFGHPIIRWAFPDIQVSTNEIAAILLACPLVLLGWYGVAARLALTPSALWRTTCVSLVSAVGGVVISFAALSSLGVRGLGLALLAMGSTAVTGSRATQLVNVPVALSIIGAGGLSAASAILL